jgi:6-phosphogluconate dehydrogenase (decarboxylating)
MYISLNGEKTGGGVSAAPVPVLTAAWYARFSSRGEADFQNQLLSAMRFQFGHAEKAEVNA